MKALILGGARSGKSQHAENCAQQCLQSHPDNPSLIYLATGSAGDDEMAQRIAHHQRRRDDAWQLVEAPLSLAKTLQEIDKPGNVIVVDCLTLWVSNALLAETVEQEIDALINALPHLESDIFFVSNEVGSGVVPLGELSRQFVDQCGWLHQALGKICDEVTLVMAGLPLPLKRAQN